tara:strand:- start:173 stop:820 length:648 start_codon:yes stop_codon:yes gene_type:complete
MATLTHNDKQIRKFEKKARHNDAKFRETQDKQYLWKADELREKAKKLTENQRVDRERKKRKVNASKKTDDQLLNEAMRQNRRERNEAEKKRKEKDEKEKELLDRRNKVKLLMKKKKEEQKKQEEEEDKYVKDMLEMREEFIKKYLEENEGHSYSQAHKEFNKALHKQRELKKKMMETFQSFGMDREMAEGCFNKMIENRTENDCEEIVVNESPRL